MAKKRSRSGSSKDNSDRKLFAFLGIFLTVIGFLIAVLTKKNDKYVMFYANQGLVLFLAFVVCSILFWIPFVGQVLWLLVFILWIIGIVYSLSGEMKKIPVIGDLVAKMNL